VPFTITNLILRPVIVPLNGGTNLRLSPGEASRDIPDVELKDNSKIDKLVRQLAIAVRSQTEATELAQAPGEVSEPPSPDGTDVSTRARRRT
jgi:hypothetical protein